MSHQSENSRRLAIRQERLASNDFDSVAAPAAGDVILAIPPFGRTTRDIGRCPAYLALLRRFACQLDADGLLAILTSAEDAAEMVCMLENVLRFQLWIAVKLERCRSNTRGLPHQHAALLVFSKYDSALRHTKTRIAYSYCPACERTTKDYGGKKHIYHQYGTLMSDVWRDVSWSPQGPPHEVVGRLADLFGLPPHRQLRVLDLRDVAAIRPRSRSVHLPFVEPETVPQRPAPPSILLRGDCLEHLPAIHDNSVDFCFADPPYNLNKVYDNWDDGLEIRNYFQWCDQWLGQLARVLKPGCTCAVLNIPLWAVRHFQFMKTRLLFQNWIVWEGLGLPVRMIMPSHYSIVCFSKGEARTPPGQSALRAGAREAEAVQRAREGFCARADCTRKRRTAGAVDTEPATDLWWDIHRLKHNARRADHPCQLPPALMQRLIAYFTSAGESVLDPFNGVGTTTLCARQLDRRYIGIELSEKYHAIAASRHALLERGGDPFAKTDAIPQAKNSRVRRIGQQRYAVTKKTLQLEVKAIAKRLGRLPTREDVRKFSHYPMAYFEQYFISWGEVCAAARTTGMSEVRAS